MAFIINRQFNNVFHYHSYSNVYIHPWGNGSFPEEPDSSTMAEIGEEMARYNGYPVGTGLSTIGYTVNGDAVDWTYGNSGVIAYTPEIGSSIQGFWPSENEVESLCENQFKPNKVFAFSAGSDFILDGYSFSNELVSGSTNNIMLNIKNRGLMPSSGSVNITVTSLSQIISIEDQTKEISTLNSWEMSGVEFELVISDQVTYFSEASIKVIIHDSESYHFIDTVNFFIGNEVSIFEESFDFGLGEWSVTGDWGLTDNPSIGLYALTDSPEGNYNAEASSTAVLDIDLDFSFIANPFISFSALWDIEGGYDFIRFQAYTEEVGWVSLQGNYTVSGNCLLYTSPSPRDS